MSTTKAVQEYYPDHFNHCYGCGQLNEHGLRVMTYWSTEGEETICTFNPRDYHTAIPGMVYGGLLACIIDCHSTGSASAFACHHEGLGLEAAKTIRYLTGSLHVDYLKPTPQGVALVLRSRLKELKGRKIVIATDLWAGDELCVKGELVGVRVPDKLEEAAKAACR